MMFVESIQYALTAIIVSILVLSSKEDLRYHRISKKYVMLILVFTLLYTVFYKTYGIERTFSFLIAFGMFSGVTILSRGMFGFGDGIIIAALALYIGKVHELGYYFIILAFTSLAWGFYCVIKSRLKEKSPNKKTLLESLRQTDMIPIDKVVPGMILATDCFMEGLNEDDILKLKKKGLREIQIKYAYPFIPSILISFVVYLAVIQYHLF